MAKTQLTLSQKILSTFDLIPFRSQWVVAFSGGLDSTVLLFAAHQFMEQLKASSGVAPRLIACHVDHQLEKDHLSWVQHTKTICQQLNIPFQLCTVDVDEIADYGLEASARRARYAALGNLLDSDQDCVLTAHHLDDQAETLLYRMARGMGPQSYRGIRAQRRLAKGHLLRPFLNLSREQLREYANENNLDWIEDSSNRNLRFDRNYLRHEVLPRLHQRWPQFSQRAAASSDTLSEQLDFLDQIAADDLIARTRHSAYSGSHLCLSDTGQLHIARLKNLLRAWLQVHEIHQINGQQWTQLLDMVSDHAGSSNSCIELHSSSGNKKQFIVYDKKLFWQQCPDLKTIEAELSGLSSRMQRQEDVRAFAIPQVGVLEFADADEVSADIGDGSNQWCAIPTDCLVASHWRLATGLSGISVNGQTKSLKNLFQAARVPAWLRPVYPVLVHEDQVLMIPGIASADILTEQLSKPPEQSGECVKNQRFLRWSFA